MQCSALIKMPYCGELGQRGSMPLTSTSSTASGLDFLSTFGVMFTKRIHKKSLKQKHSLMFWSSESYSCGELGRRRSMPPSVSSGGRSRQAGSLAATWRQTASSTRLAHNTTNVTLDRKKNSPNRFTQVEGSLQTCSYQFCSI